MEVGRLLNTATVASISGKLSIYILFVGSENWTVDIKHIIIYYAGTILCGISFLLVYTQATITYVLVFALMSETLKGDPNHFCNSCKCLDMIHSNHFTFHNLLFLAFRVFSVSLLPFLIEIIYISGLQSWMVSDII